MAIASEEGRRERWHAVKCCEKKGRVRVSVFVQKERGHKNGTSSQSHRKPSTYLRM